MTTFLPPSVLRLGMWAALLAALAVAPVAPPASAQTVRGYVPADELVSFPAETPMNQFFRLVNPTFNRVTGKSVVDPMDRTDPIGVSLNGVHFIDAFELVLDRNGLDFSESAGYFILTEPVVVATTTDGQSADAIGAAQAPQAAVAELPATADSREIRIDAVVFQLNSSRARDVGTNWAALFGEAAGSGGTSDGGAGQAGGEGAGPQFFVNAGSFFDALDGFIESSSDRVELTTILQLFRYFESQGFGQTIATPFTVVQSGQAGRLQSGQDIPITTQDISGNAITQFFSTGTIIDVTPTLIVDERGGDPVEFVHLNVKVEKSSSIPSGSGIAIAKDNIATQVNLLSGEMVAIGGLTSTDESVTRRGVPILKDIPILNFFFSYKQRQVTQSEIIIVVRARVVDDLRNRRDRDRPRDIYDQERRDAEDRIRQFGPPVDPAPVDVDAIRERRDEG